MDVRPLLAQRRAPPQRDTRLWRAFGAVALLQFVTLAAVLASRTAPDGRRQLLADELEPPFRKIREDHDLGEADERRRLSGALWGLKTVTTATTLTKFMGTMVLCDTSSAAITVTLPAASDMSEQSGASLRHYKFINTGSNDCTIARAGSDTIVTSTLTATFTGGATTSTFTGTQFTATFTGDQFTPVFTGTDYTPAGTVSVPTFTGTQTAPAGTIGAITPAGTVSQPTFTGDAYTPEGTNNAPAFTGTQYTPTGTISTITPAGSVAAPVFSGTAHTPTFTGGAITSTVTQGAITTATVYTGADGTATTTDTAVDVVTGCLLYTSPSPRDRG